MKFRVGIRMEKEINLVAQHSCTESYRQVGLSLSTDDHLLFYTQPFRKSNVEKSHYTLIFVFVWKQNYILIEIMKMTQL